jgi:hypothetical protein
MQLKERPGGRTFGASRVDQYLPRSSISALRDAIRSERMMGSQSSKALAKGTMEAIDGGCLLYRPVWAGMRQWRDRC